MGLHQRLCDSEAKTCSPVSLSRPSIEALEDVLGHVLDKGRVRRFLPVEHLQMALDDRKRSPQLVGRIGDELILDGEG